MLFGGLNSESALLRLTAVGALDTTFGGGDGVVTFPRPVGLSNPYGLAIDGSSGAIYLSYQSAAGANQGFSAVQRFAADGTPDAAFGGDGTVELVYQEGIQIESLAVQSTARLSLDDIVRISSRWIASGCSTALRRPVPWTTHSTATAGAW